MRSNFMLKNITIFLSISLLNVLYASSCFAKNICVFCSTKNSIAEVYKPIAYDLGKELAMNNLGLVTGGRNTGLMKQIIDGHASVKTHAPRYAIIPKSLEKLNVLHPSISKKYIIWTEDLHDRLRIFYTKCDAVVAMPGAFGAMHELMDAIETIKMPVYILNTDNFWDNTLKQFKTMVAVGAMQNEDLKNFKVVKSVNELKLELELKN